MLIAFHFPARQSHDNFVSLKRAKQTITTRAMKKVLILMLGLVASTASFAHQSTTQPSAAQTRLVMTADRKIKLYVQPFQTKGQLAIQDASGRSVYSSTVALQK